jgi:hypothetical protein
MSFDKSLNKCVTFILQPGTESMEYQQSRSLEIRDLLLDIPSQQGQQNYMDQDLE